VCQDDIQEVLKVKLAVQVPEFGKNVPDKKHRLR